MDDLPKYIEKMQIQNENEMLGEILPKIESWSTMDGKTFFFNFKSIPTIPSGLYSMTYSDGYGYGLSMMEYNSDDFFYLPSLPHKEILNDLGNFWDNKQKFIDYKLNPKRGIILHGDPGCHAKGTGILMFNSSIKNVEDVVVGDRLMGPNGEPREVLKLVRGVEEMVKIIPNKGEPFIVNKNHILHLTPSDKNKKYKSPINIKVIDYIENIDKKTQQKFKLTKSSDPLNKERIGFKYEILPKDDYFGFTISDDHLYLTSDFIIHHNCGKSSMIYLLVEAVKERGGISIYFDIPSSWVEIAKLIRKVEKERPILCIIEDIDLIINNYGEESFLSFLDGLNSITNVVYVATTNNIEKIPERIKDRPSRFDKKYEIKKPNAKDRELFFKRKLLPEDLKKYDLKKLVRDTDNFTMAHIKEVFISLYVLGNEYSEVISRLSKSRITEPIGFNLDNDYD